MHRYPNKFEEVTEEQFHKFWEGAKPFGGDVHREAGRVKVYFSGAKKVDRALNFLLSASRKGWQPREEGGAGGISEAMYSGRPVVITLGGRW